MLERYKDIVVFFLPHYAVIQMDYEVQGKVWYGKPRGELLYTKSILGAGISMHSRPIWTVGDLQKLKTANQQDHISKYPTAQ